MEKERQNKFVSLQLRLNQVERLLKELDFDNAQTERVNELRADVLTVMHNEKFLEQRKNA